ncbi:MAG TPA: CpsB/CapC family capsule biosynthesis tyrosine phosphatase [Solirubrobacteraceae bacterium]
MAIADLHSHILPGVDDGPANLEGSFALARAAVAAGTRQIVATPHFDHHQYISPERVGPAVAVLNRALEARGIPLVVRSGAEIALPRLFDLTDDQLALLTLGGGPYLLLESPFRRLAGEIDTLVFSAQARGYRVLLAHPERSPGFHHDPDGLRRLAGTGVLMQVTASSITGDFGEKVRSFALDMLRDGLVHVIASDAHDDARRPPDVASWVRTAEAAVPGSAQRAAWMLEAVPAAILAGEEIPAPPPLPARRGGEWRRRLARAVSSRR